MQPALGLGFARPTAGALVAVVSAIRAGSDGLGAGPAADAGVALVVQRVVGDALFEQARPDALLGGVRQGADLHQMELAVPGDDRLLGADGRLVAADAAHPGGASDGGPLQDLDLAVVAAAVGVGLIERSPMKRLVLGDRQLRLEHVDLKAVLLHDTVPQVERLLELVAGVEVEDVGRRRVLRQQRQEEAPLGAERRPHRQARRVALVGPGEDLVGRGRLEPLALGGEVRQEGVGGLLARRRRGGEG